MTIRASLVLDKLRNEFEEPINLKNVIIDYVIICNSAALE
jgi:hypothetical protein